jgi:squalene-associated FAD-dependent desaturase
MADGSTLARPRIAIVGGGLAGLAAALALSARNCDVDLFETRRRLGGRAGSYVDRTSQGSIDHCQHVAMGCCTNYLDFCRRAAIDQLFDRYSRLHFFGPDGTQNDFQPTPWLPAPLHLALPLLKLTYLSWHEKRLIARAMLNLITLSPDDEADGPTVLHWLNEQQQTASAIERFWKVVLVSALGESLDRASLAAARKVFVDGFLASAAAADILVPRVSLDELYQVRTAAALREQGARIHLEKAVATVEMVRTSGARLQFHEGREENFDAVILAVPWLRAAKLLVEELRGALDPQDSWRSIAAAPISSVHLWFDRAFTDLRHAVLVERLSQWFFARAAEPRAAEDRPSSDFPSTYYCQVVISASHDLAGRDKQSIVAEVLQDLIAVFPKTASATLLRSQVITEQQAVFSVRPGIDAVRPCQQSSIPNLYLAGDWTRTGWPATMEGAVRSGYRAAEACLAAFGRPAGIVVPDLPRGWLARRFGL